MMLFSIITVTYNSRKFLAETIKSVLSQDYADFEYIIIDGGSSDGTLEIIKDFAAEDDRIRWISEPDNGISDAFNKGLALSTGDLVGIINSDDTYSPGALATVAQAYLSDSGADVFHGDMIRFQGQTPLFLLKPGKVGDNVWYEMPLNHPATFVTRRAYLLVGGFDIGLRVAMDYELVLRLYRAGCRFRYIDRVLANMRYGGASDERFLAARREVLAVTVAAGYPRWQAVCWFVVKAGMSTAKNLLRKLGLYGLIRLHPKFKKHQEEG
jgi:glycosyltransferase involved in cell wall biosynthesis